MVIDGHVHLHPDADGLGARFDARPEALLRDMDTVGMDRAVIYGEAVDVPYIKRIPNRYVGECCAKYPDRLTGFASVHPLEPNAVEILAEDVGRYNLVGLKLHPRFQGVGADDERILPVVNKAVELDLPIAIDTLLWKPTPLRIQMAINVDTLCKRVPDARIIMAHAGGLHFIDAMAVAIANPNVYLEISLALTYFHETPFEDQFIFVLKKLGARRIIFGSDHPQERVSECYPRARRILAKHGFTSEDQDYIFGKTLVSVLPQQYRQEWNLA